MSTDLPSLTDYYARLNRHDWWYSYTDDPGVYRAGSEDRADLERIGHRSAAHADLFRAFEAWKRGATEKPAPPQVQS